MLKNMSDKISSIMAENGTSSSSDGDNKVVAARITVVFIVLYFFTFDIVLRTKRACANREGEKFDRYKSEGMHDVDRLNANFLEWSPIFLGLLWSLAATSDLSKPAVVAAWGYIGLRALYIVLVLKHGVSSLGFNRRLWISTFPAYGCLLVMLFTAIRAYFL